MFRSTFSLSAILWIIGSSVAPIGYAQSHFTGCSQQTGNSATLLIPSDASLTVDGSPPSANSEIATFTEDGVCAGVAVWTDESTGSSIWGDDLQTDAVDGFAPGGEVVYRVWDASTDSEFDASVDSISIVYGSGEPFYRTVNTYVQNAIYVLEKLAVYLAEENPLSAPALQSPTNGLHDQPLSLELSWSDTEHADSYDVQLSRHADFSSTELDLQGIAATSLQVDLGRTSTRYYWRVRAVGSGGTGAWSDTFSFTTAPSIPNAPALVSPSDGAHTSTTSVTLSWNGGQYDADYTIQLARDAHFSDDLIEKREVTTSSISIDGLDWGTTYYWRVRATNVSGAGDWSQPFSFATEEGGVSVLEPPKLLSPADGANGQPRSLNLSWEAVEDASSYWVQVSPYHDFQTRVVDSKKVSSTSISVSGLSFGTVYYWRLQAANTDTNSVWSATWKFATGEIMPGITSLIAPSDGEELADTTAALSWGTAARTDYFQLEVATTEDFDNPIVSLDSLPANEYRVTGLEAGTTYFWRVRGVNSVGSGEWAVPFAFYTPRKLQLKPVLAAPADGSTVAEGSITFRWDSEAEVDQYLFQIASNPDFSSVIDARDGLTSTELLIEGLAPNAVYYWRVAAIDANGKVEWSDVFSLTVPQKPPTTRPTVSAPLNNESVEGDVVTLKWQQVEYASSYRIQLYESSVDGLALVVDSSDIDETNLSVRVPASSEYAWQVQAINEAGTSPWSDVTKFSATGSTGTSAESETPPTSFTLHPNYPNPFNPSTTLLYDLPAPADVSIYIYNVAGSLVDVVLNEKQMPSGTHTIRWNAEDLPSGTYFCQVRAGEEISVRSLSLLK